MTKRTYSPKPEPRLAPIPMTERYLRVKAQMDDPLINTMEKNKRSKSKTVCLRPELTHLIK